VVAPRLFHEYLSGLREGKLKLTYVIQNQTDNDDLLEPGEAWKWTVNCDDAFEAYLQIERCKTMAGVHGHTILNVFLDGQRFDSRSFYTDNANADNFEYEESVKISRHINETS
jgi:hypothetical protein